MIYFQVDLLVRIIDFYSTLIEFLPYFRIYSHISACNHLFIFAFFVCFFSRFLFFNWFSVVDVIKPKPMPRLNISPSTNNNTSPNQTTTSPTISTTTISSSTTSVKSKTESIVQRFSYSAGNGHSPPEVLKRFAGKPIATIFEVWTLAVTCNEKHFIGLLFYYLSACCVAH